ncbi:hypothetical protein IJ541_02715 [bacterium]|nr:hypothetical protein [bacterium]
MGYSDVGSLLFTVRSGKKASEGDYCRVPITVAQGASVIKAVSEYNNPASKQIKNVLNIMGNDNVARRLGKVVKVASENVNGLIVLSSGVKVALAKPEDRKKTLIAETGCLAGMFAGEGWMKKNLNKYLDQLPINKKWIPLIKGIVFVTGSITCSTLGHKIGKKVAQYWDKPLISHKEETQPSENKKSINIKA